MKHFGGPQTAVTLQAGSEGQGAQNRYEGKTRWLDGRVSLE
jgi:hypothetical protein